MWNTRQITKGGAKHIVDQEYIRHGDLWFERIDKIPETAMPLPTNVVAEGEMTGHKHEFKGGSVQLYKDAEKSDVTYVEVKADSTLTHQEHRPVNFEEGVYIVKLEQEFDPFAEEIRKTMD